jgi:hypothetical protein
MPAYAAEPERPSQSYVISLIDNGDNGKETIKKLIDNIEDVSTKNAISSVKASENSIDTVQAFNNALPQTVEIINKEVIDNYPNATFETGFIEAVVQEKDGVISYPTSPVTVPLPFNKELEELGVDLETGVGLENYVLAVFNPETNKLAYVDIVDAYDLTTQEIKLPFGGLIALVKKNTNNSEPTETVE